MPASPWRNFQQPKPEIEYLAQLSYLPLVRYRSLVPFSRWLLAIQGQLRQASGLMGYSLLARPFQRDFWTLSVWLNKAALNSFFRSPPHVEAMKALRPHMGQTRFIEWTMNGSVFPPTWDDALERFYRIQ